jgi:hypothetical protein
MIDTPIAALFATDLVRRQFDPAAEPEPEPPRRARHAVHRARRVASTALLRAAWAVEPPPECSPAR